VRASTIPTKDWDRISDGPGFAHCANLNEPNAPLHKTTRNWATSPIVASDVFIDSENFDRINGHSGNVKG